MKRLFIVLLCFILILSFPQNCFAKTINYSTATPLGKTSAIYEKEMWHYTDKYWIFNNDDGSQTQVSDETVGGAMNIGSYLKQTGFTFIVPLTAEALAAYNNGDYISFTVEGTTLPIADLFDTGSYYGNIQNGNLYLHINPVMKLFGLIDMGSFVSALNVKLPLVDVTYGYNLYKIYKSSRLQGVAIGKYQIGETRITVIDNYMHPAMIKDYNGNLNSAYQVRIGDADPISARGLSVGYRTLRYGGDLGYRFIFPFAVSFTGYKYEKEDVPETPTEPEVPSKPSEEENEENEEAAIKAAASKWKLHRVK